MKYLLIAASGAALATAMPSMPVNASAAAETDQFDMLRKKAKELKKKAKEIKDTAETVENVVETVTDGAASGTLPSVSGSSSSNRSGVMQYAGQRRPRAAGRGDYAGRAPSAPAKYAAMTKCANLKLGNAFIAQAGTYTVTSGLSTEDRTGLIEREPVQPVDGCTFTGLGVGDVLYVEVDKPAYNGRGSYELQCISFDGKEQLARDTRPRENNYTGKDVMLMTGNSAGYELTASGSNADRSAAYDKLLGSRGREMITFNMPELHTDKAGTDFYCQHYNEATGQSALAFTYRRGPVGRQ